MVGTKWLEHWRKYQECERRELVLKSMIRSIEDDDSLDPLERHMEVQTHESMLRRNQKIQQPHTNALLVRLGVLAAVLVVVFVPHWIYNVSIGTRMFLVELLTDERVQMLGGFVMLILFWRWTWKYLNRKQQQS